MDVGDILTVSNEGRSQEFTVISFNEAMNLPYTVYYLMNKGGDHRLYVKKGVTLPQGTIDIKDHIIIFENEIEKDDYYFMISVPYVLPL